MGASDKFIEISYMICGILSVIVGIVVIYCYIKLHTLRKPPGMLIFFQCLGQTAIDLHWVWSAVLLCKRYTVTGLFRDNSLCYIDGGLTFYLFLMSWNYSTCTSIEVLIRIKKPMGSGYMKRSPFYHAISHLMSFTLVVIIGVYDGFGESSLRTCFVAKHHWAR
jgi:hypothetical protein